MDIAGIGVYFIGRPGKQVDLSCLLYLAFECRQREALTLLDDDGILYHPLEPGIVIAL